MFTSVAGVLGTARDAILFKSQVYEEFISSQRPFLKGLVFLLILGLLVGILMGIGDVIEYTFMPDLNMVKQTVAENLKTAPWYLGIPPEGREAMWQQYELGWKIFPAIFAPSPGKALAGVLATPLFWILQWLIYGAVAWVFARLLGGTAGLGVTLGALALGFAPGVFKLLELIPYAQATGILLGVWGFVCCYYAIKISHNFGAGKAFLVTLLPYLLILVLAVAVSVVAFALIF